ncbi:hypothetical protein S7711_10399 [Stachybotrys chartarum IBT 7711]|uniref:Uncharacterized protein n=1 Tax=Stachybotrys chartarum (strain CBS 109288 / IBT 7711) TaxID=1280523 RepID=A0A084B422_STACB|nr:hypothetical protein S7711_10399 [Stachybotrys chartarum IBT 7711]
MDDKNKTAQKEFTPSSTTAAPTAAATATREPPVVQSEPKNEALQDSLQRKYNMPDKNGWYATDRGTTDMGYWYPKANTTRGDEGGDEIEALRASSHIHFRDFNSMTLLMSSSDLAERLREVL